MPDEPTQEQASEQATETRWSTSAIDGRLPTDLLAAVAAQLNDESQAWESATDESSPEESVTALEPPEAAPGSGATTGR